MVVTVVGRLVQIILAIATVLLVFEDLQARDLNVFGTFKELSLGDKDQSPRDFYINGGTADGLSAGALVDVFRRVPLHDPSTSRPVGDLQIPVARLKIIHSDRNVSVARVHRVFGSKEKPNVDVKGVLIGDRIQVFDGEDEGEKTGSKSDRRSENKSESKSEAKAEPSANRKSEVKLEAPSDPNLGTPETKSETLQPREASQDSAIRLKAGEESADLSSRSSGGTKPAEIKVSL